MEPTGAAPLRPTDLREIGPYRLLGRLGEGGMGTVFLARAPTGRFVAVKVVKAEFANQEGFAARFHAEVDNARRVASFCTAQVLDNGDTGDGRPYMVTEYIAGTPLSDQIATYGALDPGPLHGVALGVAAALAAIHVAELVHRDLKPANVILSLSGPRVIDFGIARALDRETGFTLSGELLGSPGWWAPEQVRGQSVTPAADIFAWGCLVAYAGNGRHPFGRGDPITLATRVLHLQPDLGVLPAPLDELVRRATDMEPARRPTAQELVLALVGGAAPTSANPPTLVATEVLSDWRAPQNVVDEPDITATFTTPPPGDTTAVRPAPPGDTTAVRPAAPDPQKKEAAHHTLPPPDSATDPGHQRPRGTRWLIAGAAALLAIAVTGAVLIATSGRDGGGPGASASPVAAGQPAGDVGRRFTLGAGFDDPMLIVPSAPECGLKEYDGRTQTQGQLCVLRWTVLNPGGTSRELGDPAVTLRDDQGGSHGPLEGGPRVAALGPGDRIDGVFVFDLPLYRKPVALSATMLKDGDQIEVRL
ncbi:protein kinase domain-containing protein [Nonomuraea sp. NPDC003214]